MHWITFHQQKIPASAGIFDSDQRLLGGPALGFVNLR